MMSPISQNTAPAFIDNRDQTTGNPLVLEAKELHRHYRVGRGMFKGHAELRAVNGASFTLAAGRTLAVVGESGCGKSTLARLVTLIETPTSGSLSIDGIDVASADPATVKAMCIKEDFAVSSMERLPSGGTRVVLVTLDGADALRRALKGKVIDGAVERVPLRQRHEYG